MDLPIIQIENLKIHSGQKTLLNLPKFECSKSQVHAIIGESGSGKSLTLLTIIGLLPRQLSVSGSVYLNVNGSKIDLLNLSSKEFQKIRGKLIGMVFQEPMSALNPQMTCGDQLFEAYLVHQSDKKQGLNCITQN